MVASLGNSICTRNCPRSTFGKNSAPINPNATNIKEEIKIINVTITVIILLNVDFKHHSKIPLIQCVNFSNCFSNQRMNFSNGFFPVKCTSFPNLDDNQGIIVKEANNDNIVAITTVTQNCAKILDTNPELIAIGKNTTTITNVIAVTVNPISEAPSYAARILLFPISI